MSSDLFAKQTKADPKETYDASQIEVLEGLEPVRKRPGMYIGGTDERAFHHLASEILDNAMDEAVAGHANRIDVTLEPDNTLSITDNGRGIPVDDHPKFPGTSALEVILTTLHSGGKFSGKAYQTSGGLHGVGISVVNALSEHMRVEVARDRQLYAQEFSRGKTTTKLEKLGAINNRRGTKVTFKPDPDIFGKAAKFKPAYLYQLTRSKAYLFRGVEIHWHCDPSLLLPDSKVKEQDVFHFPNGLQDFLLENLKDSATITEKPFAGLAEFSGQPGRVEYAIAWPSGREGFIHSYCNTVPTPQGGTHESGLRTALTRGLKAYGEMTGNKKAGNITAEDILGGGAVLLSVFIPEPQFQGQTKEKLASAEATKLVESVLKDRFDHWLSADPASANKLLEEIIERAEDRMRRRDDKQTARKTATAKLRLPGKLADCSRSDADGTEIFIVEGDSAGGSAKQARNRETQAVLPLRGKILNVVSATADKIRANQELSDLQLALGCGIGKNCTTDNLRYEKIIIMTDADVDGAHIAALLMTFFYTQMRPIVDAGRLYIAQPPLYRLVSGKDSVYAKDDAHKEELLVTQFKNRKVEISRFKGLGEMPAAQLKETTMKPESRSLLRVSLPIAQSVALGVEAELIEEEVTETNPAAELDDLVDRLMGKQAEARFKFIQDNAEFAEELDV